MTINEINTCKLGSPSLDMNYTLDYPCIILIKIIKLEIIHGNSYINSRIIQELIYLVYTISKIGEPRYDGVWRSSQTLVYTRINVQKVDLR